jgi:3'-phosphoadenosine 5'-phosphosulfate sulfotransferase (PAPS reductase)/FAD synthetase
LFAAEMGRDFALVMADTGNEQEVTWESGHRLAEFLGRPLQVARADFSARIARKREYVATRWREEGVDEATVERALAVLHPTGNPFLDLCIWKGRFPSRKAQFCTEFLKQEAIETQVIVPAMKRGSVVQWLGVRRDESLNRRDAPMFQKVRRQDGLMLFFRPIIHWTAENVISFARSKGAPLNPLYSQGFGRVGCFPCINASKGELAEMGRRYPEIVERLREWEEVVKAASKRHAATFFASDVTPEGADLGRRLSEIDDPKARRAAGAKAPWPKADQVFEWAKTTRGGRQFDLLGWGDDGLSCSSQYGLCE